MGSFFSYNIQNEEREPKPNTGNTNREYKCGEYFKPEHTIREHPRAPK